MSVCPYDPMTYDGAEWLADMVRLYWARRGHAPEIRVEPIAGEFEVVSPYLKAWVVRSDMINGHPR